MTSTDTPTLAEDLLLLLFQPASGTIAGESTLYSVLAGAVLAELALDERVTAAGSRVEAIPGRAPTDGMLREAWQAVAEQPRDAQSLLAMIGPALRAPVLARLVARGDIDEQPRKVLGLFPSTALVLGGTGRRRALLEAVRAVLVDGAEPQPRVAALAALLFASGALPQLDPEIPWSSPVIARAEQLQRGNRGADAAGEAIARTVAATALSSILIATTVLPRS